MYAGTIMGVQWAGGDTQTTPIPTTATATPTSTAGRRRTTAETPGTPTTCTA